MVRRYDSYDSSSSISFTLPLDFISFVARAIVEVYIAQRYQSFARCIRTKGKVERFGTFIIVYRKSKCFQVTDFPEINARDKYTIALRLRLLFIHI